ncbi:MAG: IS1634 family transposase [Deltaproteobacteria bacterium]|nr:IS1634 family transposase [Deltaproteobacteria bacterium]
MFIRVTKQRRADGSSVAYMQLAESVWNSEQQRSDNRIIHNIGRADDPEVIARLRRLAKSIMRRCSPEEMVAAAPEVRVRDAWSYGDVYALERLWEDLGIGSVVGRLLRDRHFEYSVERALFAMVANRACAPCSKLYCWEQWLREDVRIEGAADLGLHQLYRAMDWLEANRDSLEKEIFFRVSDLLNLDVDLIFYDTTSLHFEVEEEDRGVGEQDTVHGSKQSGGKVYRAPRKRGYSKNGRGDAPQIVVGLAVTRDGLPVRHWVFPGNTVDVTTVAKVKEELRGWRLGRCLFVGDAGMVSADNLRTLSLGGGRYILCMPMRRGDEVTQEVLSRPGRYRDVTENLRVKEVVVGEGERRRRYVVCHNPEEEARQRLHREQVLKEIEAELTSLRECGTDILSKRVAELRASQRHGRYLHLNSSGHLEINRAKVRDEERYDGKFVVHSNDDSLSADDMALGYKQLMRVEEAWRTLKSGLRLRPVYHWTVHRIHAHVAVTVLALLLERAAERACKDTWRNIRDDLRRIKLVHLSTADGEVWQVTEPDAAARARLDALKVAPPPAVLRVG